MHWSKATITAEAPKPEWKHRFLTQGNPAASVSVSHGLSYSVFTYRGLRTCLGAWNVADWVNSNPFSHLVVPSDSLQSFL